MLYACVNMIFWRVFMRISYTCPAHLTFSLTVEKWTNLVKLTGDVIDWLDKHDELATDIAPGLVRSRWSSSSPRTKRVDRGSRPTSTGRVVEPSITSPVSFHKVRHFSTVREM